MSYISDEAYEVLYSIVNTSIRLIPAFVCLKPKWQSKVNIAAAYVYIWVIMISAQFLFFIEDQAFSIFQGIFSIIYFLVLFTFFEGKLVYKAFLYLSAWMFSLLQDSLAAVFIWVVNNSSRISPIQLQFIIAVVMGAILYLIVKYWLEIRLDMIFQTLSGKSFLPLLLIPVISVSVLLITFGKFFSIDALLNRGFEDSVIYFALCAMIMIVYFLYIENTYEIISKDQTKQELKYARQFIDGQKEYYTKTLEYISQIRTIKHDFRHHIHALLYMSKDEQQEYLRNLQEEMYSEYDESYCENHALNSLLQEYAVKTKKHDINFTVNVDIPNHFGVDDLTLCIVVGNLLENALEASMYVETGRFITLSARIMDGKLIMLIENKYDGQVKEKNGKLYSKKRDGGLGIISIKRILSGHGDDFEFYYNENTFSAMATIEERAGDL